MNIVHGIFSDYFFLFCLFEISSKQNEVCLAIRVVLMYKNKLIKCLVIIVQLNIYYWVHMNKKKRNKKKTECKVHRNWGTSPVI